MCLMMYVASAKPLAGAREVPEGGVEGMPAVDVQPADAPVRRHFTQPHVARVESYGGCGCYFSLSQTAWAGVGSTADVLALQEALDEDERASLLACVRSRALLRELIEGALPAGEVEIFTCWDGDQAGPAASPTRKLDPAFLTETLEPLDESVLHVVRSPPAS